MNITYSYKESNIITSTVITIGAFDGVHLGHQGLIRQMVISAQQRGLPAWVVTFDPLPWQVLSGNTGKQLTCLSDRLEKIALLEVTGTIVLHFDDELMALSARSFVDDLVRYMHPEKIWVGNDFRFGARQGGDVRLLQTLGAEYRFETHVFEEIITWGGSPVRSSRIRDALKEGNLAEANACLGRPFHLCGIVGHGDQRGRTLGFPTANLIADENLILPAKGVYVCRVHLNDRSYQAVTNVGTRPTFNNRPPTVEAHLLDFDDDIYGEKLKVEFLHRLRTELKFTSAVALINQMQLDKREARRYFEAQVSSS